MISRTESVDQETLFHSINIHCPSTVCDFILVCQDIPNSLHSSIASSLHTLIFENTLTICLSISLQLNGNNNRARIKNKSIGAILNLFNTILTDSHLLYWKIFLTALLNETIILRKDSFV